LNKNQILSLSNIKLYLYQKSKSMFIKYQVYLYQKLNFIFIKNQFYFYQKSNFIFIKTQILSIFQFPSYVQFVCGCHHHKKII